MRSWISIVAIVGLSSACSQSGSDGPDETGSGGRVGAGGVTSGGGQGGAAPGGGTSGGSTAGGASMGGSAQGGNVASGGIGSGGNVASGGVAQGGKATSGGTSNGGSASGGASNVGGASKGGTSSGGAATGGGASKGGASNGGTSSGGASSAGGASGGKAQGGSAQGGKANASGGATSSGGSGGSSCGDSYDALILCDKPVGYWRLAQGSGTEPDLSGRNNAGTYKGGATSLTTLPNGDGAAVFNGSSQYVTIPSNAAYSIPTTGKLSWEAWIKPSVLQFPNDSGGYVDWMGKCASYSPTCEWEARLYNTQNSENRCNRFSAYAFNPSAGLGSGADWQPTCGLIQANAWYHVVGEYTTLTAPTDCQDTATYPGSLDIWVNGIKWNHSRHGQTGCMSQYDVIPKANNSPVNVGTMAQDAWFQGAIAKLAIYDVLLTDAQVKAHYRAMTGADPTGSCANDCTF